MKWSDGTDFRGLLEPGQMWRKGNTLRVIQRFDSQHMYYKNKKDIVNGTVTKVTRSVFRRWLRSGAVVQVKE